MGFIGIPGAKGLPGHAGPPGPPGLKGIDGPKVKGSHRSSQMKTIKWRQIFTLIVVSS